MTRYAPYAVQLCVAAWIGIMAGNHRVQTAECRREAATLLSMTLHQLTELKVRS